MFLLLNLKIKIFSNLNSLIQDIKERIISLIKAKPFKGKIYQDKKNLIKFEEKIIIDIFGEKFEFEIKKLPIFDFDSLFEKELPNIYFSPIRDFFEVKMVKNFEYLSSETKNLEDFLENFYEHYQLRGVLKTEFFLEKEFSEKDLTLKKIEFSLNNNFSSLLGEKFNFYDNNAMEELEFEEKILALKKLLKNKIENFFNQL